MHFSYHFLWLSHYNYQYFSTARSISIIFKYFWNMLINFNSLHLHFFFLYQHWLFSFEASLNYNGLYQLNLKSIFHLIPIKFPQPEAISFFSFESLKTLIYYGICFSQAQNSHFHFIFIFYWKQFDQFLVN